MESSHVAVLSSFGRYTTFSFGGTRLIFRTCDGLERYTRVLKWDKGYIEVMAKYRQCKEEIEEYIDLEPGPGMAGVLRGIVIRKAQERHWIRYGNSTASRRKRGTESQKERRTPMSDLQTLTDDLMQDAAFRKEYEALQPEREAVEREKQEEKSGRTVEQKTRKQEEIFSARKPVAIGGMSREEIDRELAKGYASAKSGKTYSADEVKQMLKDEFGI